MTSNPFDGPVVVETDKNQWENEQGSADVAIDEPGTVHRILGEPIVCRPQLERDGAPDKKKAPQQQDRRRLARLQPQARADPAAIVVTADAAKATMRASFRLMPSIELTE